MRSSSPRARAPSTVPAERAGRPSAAACQHDRVSTQDEAKERAGRHAASYVRDGMKVGLGTGSTVHWTIIDLGDQALDITCTATSIQTHELGTSLGLTMVTADDIGSLDI